MTFQVLIPYLSTLWCLQDCIESFGDSDIPVTIVDNSPTEEAIAHDWPSNVDAASYGANLGIAASWNVGLKVDADQTIIMSQTVRLAPAELSRRKEPWGLGHLAKGIEKYGNEYGLTFGDQGYHLVSIGRKTVEEIGLFDENFMAYGEDDDYRHRMDLAGITMPDWGDYEESGAYSIAFAIQKRIKHADESMVRGQHRIRDYYSFKWGLPHPGSYEHPFNDTTKGLDFWPEVRHG